MPTLVTDGISPKTIGATIGGIAAGVVLALLNALQDDPTMLGALPAWAQFVILTAIPAILAGVPAYFSNPGPVVEARTTI